MYSGAWWEVDLGGTFDVVSIDIYNNYIEAGVYHRGKLSNSRVSLINGGDIYTADIEDASNTWIVKFDAKDFVKQTIVPVCLFQVLPMQPSSLKCQ